jgi:alkane 1-monooxygenase
MAAVLHLYPLVMALVGVGTIFAGGFWPLVFVAYVFGGNAVLEAVLPNPVGPRHAGPSRASAYFTALVVLALPVHLATVGAGLYRIVFTEVSWFEIFGITLLMGVSGGSLAMVAAHELVHRRQAWLRGVGVGLLLTVNNPHFRIEHVYNHHKNVGTPRDPASARLGESVHAFVPRSIAGQYLSAWRTEAERLRRRGHARFGPRNRMIQYQAMMLVVNVAVGLVFGWLGWAVFLVQSYLALNALEIINYIEHYGLARREVAPGKYERQGPQHSWNSAHFATDFGLFKLGRHSAHHMDAHLPYPDLYNEVDAPQLPMGYAGCYLAALVPPLWRRVMDERVAAVQAAHAPADAAPSELVPA